MCKYCENGHWICSLRKNDENGLLHSGEVHIESSVIAGKKKYVLEMMLDKDGMGQQIHYCPMCGRKLESEETE